MSASITIVAMAGLALGGLSGIGHESGDTGAAADLASQPSRPVDRDAWARKLTGLNEADWRTAFAVGQELAALPADEGFAILAANWEKVREVGARQQLLKAWYFAMPYPLHIRDHPRLLDGLDLGMRDRSPEVREWARGYLDGLAFEHFPEDLRDYRAWYQANRDKPWREVVAGSVRRFAARAAHSVKSDAQKQGIWLERHWSLFRDVPEARQAALDAGFSRTLGRWASGAEVGSPREERQLAANALAAIGRLEPGEAELRRVVVPLLDKKKPVEVRAAAIGALEGKEDAWAMGLLLDVLKGGLEEEERSRRAILPAAGRTLGSFEDPRVIPTLIAVIEADNTPHTIYGVGHFGLNRLTGVLYDKTHDGPWWRRWWDANKGRYPEAAGPFEVPKLAKKPPTKPAPDEPPADVADVPARDLRAGGDEKKRYFLIGAGKARPPAEGYRLLIVLPGGDGSADFQPFIRRIYKNALNDRWLVAQAVAPKWDEEQFDRVVWPTATSGYPAARFTTEEFIRAIVADVRAREKIDPRRVILLGWSSGGPPCYAMAMRRDSGVAGALIAMSVFHPEQLPALENARDKAFYLLQSPQDRITPMRDAEAAEAALRSAGAKVRLRRYEGGHGWHGDLWTMIGDGLTWLDQQAGGAWPQR
jgi:predicted esterase